MKTKVILVTSLALMLATAGTTFAAGNGQGACNGTGVGQGTEGERHYANCQGTGDADGDGICDLTGNPVGTGAFVDADGDGVCDVGGGTHPQDGSGMRHGGRTR
ncbi:MAG: hypothetical protein L6276_10005 [Acetobacterium sp.]|nr:hypothetical protein [Acetobacterium sp.]